ncbi:LysR family transcriptional regulator [Oligella urethralis]|uniref:LysR substrate-binding domain-containing protein n=1 Tax=Oligella urethralis TaxID=90245 RepID=UPI000C99A430|nr:LysR substrate-binding domain-containing protein [Oligella urethralis]PMC16560.1 LysR family transcriptional regulator [Oligella urethralis]
MNIKQLKYFSKIYELRNMTRAAESLHIAQPALSQQLLSLEDELKSQLFIRENKGVSPTRAADFLYGQAQTILRQLEATKALILNSSGHGETIAGKISIGLASSTASMLSLPLIQRIQEKFPGILLELMSITSADLPTMLRDGRCDFILAPDPHQSEGVSIEGLLIEELFFIVANRIPKVDSKITIKNISNTPLILPSPPNKLRARVDHAFLLEQLTYNLLAESGTVSILLPAVINGLAGTILPYSSAPKELDNGIVFAYPFKKTMYREISICYNNTIPLTPAVRSVMNCCVSLVAEMIETGVWKHCKLNTSSLF